MNLRRIAPYILAASAIATSLSLPISALFTASPARADTTTITNTNPSHSSNPSGEHRDDRPRIEERHEGLQGLELFILGGAFVAALGIAYRVGRLSIAKKNERHE